jgi:hypothetical protein
MCWRIYFGCRSKEAYIGNNNHQMQRLYSTQEQQNRLEQLLTAEDGPRTIFEGRKQQPYQFRIHAVCPYELKESHQWLCNYHSKILQMVVHQVDAAGKARKTLSEHGKDW